MMKNKSDLTITEIDDIYQSMSAAELWQSAKDIDPLRVKYIEPVVSPKLIQNLSIEETTAYIQSLSIAEIKAMFANGRRVQINWAEDMPDEEDDFVKLPSNGLTTNTYAMPETVSWELHEDAEPMQASLTKGTKATSEKIWAIMDLTDLDYESVEKILFEPKRAAIGDIAVYCKGLNIDFWEFIGKALA